jgi:SPP1 family predicted phage head-tail adaptor
MRAGRLDRRVELQKPTASLASSGQDQISWVTVATVWAAVEPIRGRETFDAQKIASEVDVKILIRHRSDVLPTWRVRLNDTVTSPVTVRIFRIIDVVNPFDARSELQLMCAEFPIGEGN